MMLSVPINGQVQSRLIPPTFVEDNISDMFKAVDAGHNIVVTAVDEYGNRTSITTPDNVNHDMLGRPLEFASHPVLMRNVRRWMVWLLQAQYCKDTSGIRTGLEVGWKCWVYQPTLIFP
jgi:hypothetical protein